MSFLAHSVVELGNFTDDRSSTVFTVLTCLTKTPFVSVIASGCTRTPRQELIEKRVLQKVM